MVFRGDTASLERTGLKVVRVVAFAGGGPLQEGLYLGPSVTESKSIQVCRNILTT